MPVISDPLRLARWVDQPDSVSTQPQELMWHGSDFSTGMSLARVEPHAVTSRTYVLHSPWGSTRRDFVTGDRLRLTRCGKGDYLEIDEAAFQRGPAPVRLSGHPRPVAVIGRCAREPEIAEIAVWFDALGFYGGGKFDVDHAEYPNLATGLVALGFRHCV